MDAMPVELEMKPHWGLLDTLMLVVSTHLKNISQNGNRPQVGVKIKHG